MRSFTFFLLFITATLAAHAQDRYVMTGPYSLAALKVYAAFDGQLYAITADFQATRSTDDGKSWKPCAKFGDPFVTGAVNAARLLAIDSTSNIYGIYNNMLWASFSDGAFWSPLPLPQPTGYNAFLEVSRSGNLFTSSAPQGGGDTVTLHSNDRGRSWDTLVLPIGMPPIQRMSIARDGTIYAGCWGGVWRSTDNGTSWDKTKLNISANERPDVLVAKLDGKLWAVVAPYWTLYTSEDGGGKWTEIEQSGSNPLPPNTPINALAISNEGTLFASTELGVYRSSDGGHTWEPKLPLSSVTKSYWVAASPLGSVSAVAGELRRSSDDGLTWTNPLDIQTPVNITGLLETSDNKTLLAGSTDNLYRSDDGGRNWTPIKVGLQDGQYTFALFHGKGKTLFASQALDGLYRSEDNGRTWEAVTHGLTANGIFHGLTLRNGTILLGTEKGIWRSGDNGDNWSQVPGTLSGDTADYFVQPDDTTVLVATRGRGVYRSNDNGNTWIDNSNNGMGDPDVRSLFVTPQGAIFAGTAQNGIYRSIDNAKTWTHWYYGDEQFPIVYANYAGTWAINDAGTIYIGTQGIIRSASYGTWRPDPIVALTAGSFTPEACMVQGLLIDHTGRTWLGLAGQSVQGLRYLVSDSGKGWIKDKPLPRVQAFWQPNQNGLDFATAGGVWAEDMWTGQRFPYSRGLEGADVRAITFGGPYFWVGTANGAYWHPNGGDVDWKPASSGLRQGPVNVLERIWMTIGQSSLTVAGTEHGVYVTRDSSLIWSDSSGAIGDTPIRALLTLYPTLETSDNRTIFASAAGKGLFRSEDNTATWKPSGIGLPQPDVLSLADIGTNTLFAGTEGAGVYRSIDKGATWQPAGPELAGDTITALSVSAEGLVFAGTQHGAYRSTDRGATWTRVSPEQNGRIYALQVMGTGRIYISSDEGLYYSAFVADTQSTTGLVQEYRRTDNADAMLTVVQGSMGTKIRYAVPRAGHVTLVLYDALGREALMLLDAGEEAGEHTLSFEISSLPSGMYFLRLSADGAVATQRLVVAQ